MRSVSLALVLVALCAGPLTTTVHGQERVEQERRAPQDTIARDTALQDTLIVQPEPPTLGYDPAAFSLELTVGLPGSGDAQRQPAVVRLTDIGGATLDSAVLTRVLSVRGGVAAGAGAVIGLGRDWAARVGVSAATARVETAYRGSDPDSVLLGAANAVPGTRADLTLFSVETSLRYRIPSRRRVHPYLEIGAAWSAWSGRGTLPDGLQDDFGDRFEATAGVGGVIPLTPRFSARIHAATRLFRTPVGPRADGDTIGTRLTPGWPPTRKDRYRRTVLVADAPNQSRFADGALETLSLLRLQVGISWDLHTARKPAPRTEPADSTPPPGP